MILTIKNFFIGLYTQLVRMNDQPGRIAFGFGLGVFLGIFPGTGPIAALLLAFLLQANKAAALLGSVLTNTWLSVVTFALSIKIGAAVFGLQWDAVQARAVDLFHHFSWKALFDASMGDVVKPLLVGYLITGFLAGILAYFTVLVVLKNRRRQTR